MRLRILSCIFMLISAASSHAEKLYVTDRIILGVHQAATEDSPIIAAIPSGTEVDVVSRTDNFTKVKLEDNKEGWVSTRYLKDKRPATAELDTLYAKLQKEQETTKKLSETLSKQERELQVRRDELSNAKTSIKELKDKLNSNGAQTIKVNDDSNQALEKANAEIAALHTQLKELETRATEAATTQENTDIAKLLKTSESENYALRSRIEAALANLEGRTVPSAEELAAIRPKFPIWYWILLIAMIIVGVAAGIVFWDIRHRRRHGGFRL